MHASGFLLKHRPAGNRNWGTVMWVSYWSIEEHSQLNIWSYLNVSNKCSMCSSSMCSSMTPHTSLYFCVFSVSISLSLGSPRTHHCSSRQNTYEPEFLCHICVIYHAHLVDKKLCVFWEQRWNLLLIMWYVYYIYAFSIADIFLCSQKVFFYRRHYVSICY